MRQAEIARGRFIVTDLEEIPEYNALKNRITDDIPNAYSIRKQLKEAFMFKDSEMIQEIKSFILSNITNTLFAAS